MAYQVLARQWRPKSFQDLKGQEYTVQALQNSLASGQLHHAYLFTGTRGVGKTTIARILAKCLNCEQGVSATPCGECDSCKQIDAGSFVDLIEVDAASRTKVEDTRELLDNVQYLPTKGRYKIYIIDEVHMLSGHSFNALLKTLEEPPEYVKFILATTDPEKIPVTVRSRCLQFNLLALSKDLIVEQLESILKAQQVDFEAAAVAHIAEAAAGSMRDGLSLLEQAIAYGQGALKAEQVAAMLGFSQRWAVPALLDAIIKLDAKHSLEIITKLNKEGADFSSLLTYLLEGLHALVKYQIVGEDAKSCFAEVDSKLFSLAAQVTAQELQLLYQIGLMGRRDLPYAPNPSLGFEMIVLRMIAFWPNQEQASVTNNKITTSTTAPAAIPAMPSTPPAARQVPPHPTVVEAAPAVPSVADEATSQVASGSIDWDDMVAKLRLSGLAMVLAKNSRMLSFDGKTLSLVVDSAQSAFLNANRTALIEQAVSANYGQQIKVNISPGDSAGATPMQKQQAAQQEKLQQTEQIIRQDEIAKKMIDDFDATVENVKSLD